MNGKPIITISFSLCRGGAGRAASDFAQAATLCRPGSDMVMADKQPVSGLLRARWYLWWVLRVLEHGIIRLIYRGRTVKQSLNTISEPKVARVLRQHDGTTQLHLHWIANSTISLRDLGRLPAGTLITMHDEWLYSGSTHYGEDPNYSFMCDRWSPLGRLGTLLDQRIFRRKLRAFAQRDDLVITVPSHWMKARVEASGVFAKSKIVVLPNAVDTDVFAPDATRRERFRSDIGVDRDEFVLCFGADQSGRNSIKGADLLVILLAQMAQAQKQFGRVTILVFGGLDLDKTEAQGIRVINLGYVADRQRLAAIYGGADACLHFAKLEAFGLVPCEAMACGTPVICFDNSGAAELVDNGSAGVVCPAFDLKCVARAISDLMAMDVDARARVRETTRNRAVENFSLTALERRYSELLSLVQQSQ